MDIGAQSRVFGGTRTTTRCFDDDDDDDARGGGGGRGGRHESNDDERNVRVRAGHAAAAASGFDEKAKEQFYKKENQNVDKSETGGGGGVSEKQARKMWHEKQMALDKKKKKIKVNGKVFLEERYGKNILRPAWNGRVGGTEDENANRRQMFAKRASFKTCAVISSGAALKGKRYGKIDEHEVVVRLNMRSDTKMTSGRSRRYV